VDDRREQRYSRIQMDKALSPAETTKATSRFLRGPIAEDLATDTDVFSKGSVAILKFHGVYQQDDRDVRKAGPKQYSAMVRVGIPGGLLTPEQYLALDTLADKGDASLRITTRQDIQFHYVSKYNLRDVIHDINKCLLTTLAACGDVARNVTCSGAPFDRPAEQQLEPYAKQLGKALKPKTTAYYEIWVGGEKAASVEESQDAETVEPIYGATYLPRKFKLGFTYPGDNSTDIFTNDVGFVPHIEDGKIAGFTVLAGGGMGQSAGVKQSHPRLADPICFIGPDQAEVLEIATAILTIHRDFGNRSNRKLARLKYVMDEWGVAKFKQELESRVGRELAPPKDLQWTHGTDHLGWHRQGTAEDGTPLHFVGVRVIAGRIRDFEDGRHIRTALRKIVQEFQPSVRLTSLQNLYLSNIRQEDKPRIAEILREHGIAEPEQLPPVLRHAMSCPALPTWGQAITESERIMPEVVADVQTVLNQAGLGEEVVHLRTTGCPNGCARPYTAEIGIVGASVNMYSIYLGGTPLGTRLAQLFAQNVKREQLAERLRPVIQHYREQRHQNEPFGDFCSRVGIDQLRRSGEPALATN
jgi:sulfite reductase (ferredoxin)